MKTQFEEIWSEIHYTDHYNRDNIIFWYLGDQSLVSLELDDIIELRDNMLMISKFNKQMGEEYISWIPVYRVYVITHQDDILLDRRNGYQGYKNLQLHNYN